MSEFLRQLPSVDQVLGADSLVELSARYRRDALADLVRDVLDHWRTLLRTGDVVASRAELVEAICNDVIERCSVWEEPSMRTVINATGVVLHTGLGRAPLSQSARQALGDTAGYTNIEYDLLGGRRGERTAHVEELLCQLCGAEAVAIVNNNAAAVLLALSALARGRNVLVSRGQLVEIGGSFRIPDVIESSGAHIREVGTTNRTHLQDYEAAIDDGVGAILVVHPSNYRVRGFTAEASLEELAVLARSSGVPLIYDLGGGVLEDLTQWALPPEPVVRDELGRGADVVTFSGDKVLGGPQVGIVAGREPFIKTMRTHAMMRALRCDKLTYGALSATLQHYRLKPDLLCEQIPVLRMLRQSRESVEERARTLASALDALESDRVNVVVIESIAQAGSGALPLEELPSFAVALAVRHTGVEEFARRLRCGSVAVVGRIEHERLLLDMRTVADGEIDDVIRAIEAVLQ
jgi:L-seryl-tRNA(Ser) seleniumtransferase